MNNVVGKLFIILQLIFSVMFMCFAGAVYSVSGDWRKKALDEQGKAANFSQQLDEEKQSNIQKLEELNEQIVNLTAERDKLNSDLVDATTRYQQNQGLLDEVRQERDKAIAEIEVATAEESSRRAESVELRAELQSLRTRINELIREGRVVEDQKLELSGLVASAQQREEQQLEEIGRLSDLLRQNDLDPRMPVVGPVPEDIVKVDGFVEETQKSRDRTQEFIKVTIGSDDRIFKDQQLTVFRQGKYLAEIRLIDVKPDSAVGIVLEKTRNGSIQRGDNVTTKL
jgi:predicted  nucleic acid-binding Zn-ribbon protein